MEQSAEICRLFAQDLAIGGQSEQGTSNALSTTELGVEFKGHCSGQ
jgi:hypothetical protein